MRYARATQTLYGLTRTSDVRSNTIRVQNFRCQLHPSVVRKNTEEYLMELPETDELLLGLPNLPGIELPDNAPESVQNLWEVTRLRMNQSKYLSN